MKKQFLILFASFSILFSFNLKINAQTNFDKRTSFEVFLKKTEVEKKEFVVEYMHNYNIETYKKYRNDEFEFQAKKKEQLDQIISNIEQIKDLEEYYIVTGSRFGEYDFDDESFSFRPLEESTYFRLHKGNIYACDKCNTDTEVNIFFNHTKEFTKFKMPSEEANNLVKSRKSSSGNVNRDVTIKIYFTLAEKINIEHSDYKYKAKVFGNINKIEVLDMFGYKRGTGEIITTMVNENGVLEEKPENDNEVISEANQKMIDLINSMDISQAAKDELIEKVKKKD